MKSFYDNITFLHVCNSDVDSVNGCASTNNVYSGSFIKPKFNIQDSVWFESASDEEKESFILSRKTILATICESNNYPYLDEMQIEYDKCGFLTPKEARYGLKGIKLNKDYFFENILVVSQVYETQYENKTHLNFTIENVPVKTIKKIRFYIDENHYKEKIVETLNFDVQPSEAKDQSGNIVAVTFNSMKLEKYLKQNRQEADVLMKSFNPILYNWLYSAYGSIYTAYLDTGSSSNLKQAFENETNPTNLFILNKVVEESDLAILLGPMEAYPQITVKQLILMNLQ